MKRYIGGEFEINVLPEPSNPSELTQGLSGSWTVTGRAALYALLEPLKKLGITKVLLPAYLCDSVLQPVRACGIGYEFYPVGEDLTAYPDPPKNSVVLLIHYFGWLNPNTELLRKEAGDAFLLIEDMTHALLSDWEAVKVAPHQIFFSIRKFGPVPLGGWFNRVKTLPASDPIYLAVFWKSMAVRLFKYNYLRLNTKINDHAEQKYIEMLHEVENLFDSTCTPFNLENEARYVINGIDWRNAAIRRRRNWNILHSSLYNSHAPFYEFLPKRIVPLGYVIRSLERDKLRQILAANHIFCPVHWLLPDEIDVKRFPISHKLSQSLLTIPIDQRYVKNDMEYIADIFRKVK